jgi:RNA polymerase sigma-70 factor (ECF subfamily)
VAHEFETTRWSLIVAAGGAGEHASAALAELCRAYWRPVYAFIRRRGHSDADAADLTQAFFLHLLEHHAIERADQSRGRFRSYLLTSAHNFVASARQRERTLRRGARVSHESLEASRGADHSLSLSAQDRESSPESVFERHWALNVTERALERVRADYVSRGQEHVFDELKPFLTSDGSAPGEGPADREAPAAAAARTGLLRLRRRFGEALRAEIRETVDEGHDVDDELRFLLRVLGR